MKLSHLKKLNFLLRWMALSTSLIFTPWALAQAQPEEWVFTMGGDINFNKGNIEKNWMPTPHPDGYNFGNFIPWEDLTRYLAYHIDGDLNFANIETVISERGDMRPSKSSGFAFVSHPNSLRHLISNLGFNWFSLANNHAYDFGRTGYQETLINMMQINNEYQQSVLYHGIGIHREDALTPKVMEVNGLTVAFAAIGIMDPQFRPTETQAGMLSYHSDEDYLPLLDRLAQTPADIRVVSIHFGREGQIELDPGQAARFRLAATRGGADIVLGHHPHVVRPVEILPYQGQNDVRNGKPSVIYYSFGNYLMLGAADRDNKAVGYDYGLLSKLYLSRSGKNEPIQIDAIELVALKGTHHTPWALSDTASPSSNPEKNFKWASERMSHLLRLGRRELPNTAIEFGVNFRGHGVACSNGPKGYRAENLCRGLAPL